MPLTQKSPKRVLEIGSYVGITANLIASLLPDDIRIDAIDPNQPLRVEDGVMTQTELGLAMRPFDLGRAVAQDLGVGHKVFWHEGEVPPARHMRPKTAASIQPSPLWGMMSAVPTAPLILFSSMRCIMNLPSGLILSLQRSRWRRGSYSHA